MNLAKFSPDMRYRYALARNLGFHQEKGSVLFIMLNPSTATDTEDDPTIRRCIDFARRWGYGWMYVGNLSPLRATDPAELKTAGPEPKYACWQNIKSVRQMALKSDLVVCAWGNHGGLEDRDRLINFILSRSAISTMCFGVTKKGFPTHPLYMPKSIELTPYLRPEV